MSRSAGGKWRGVIEEYREHLPVTEATPVVTLLEGGTPLNEVPAVAKRVGRGCKVFVKYEGLNPTGSFKDRGMTLAISKAKEEGAEAVMCASTGNTSASAAAYAARCGMKCVVLLEQASGAIALGKLAQALIEGATVIGLEGNFDEALNLVRKITAEHPIALVNSINPYRIQGQKTGAFEICDVLGRAPDYHAIPVGNAGNITAYWAGYKEYQEKGRTASRPVMLGFQAEGAAPIVRGEPVAHPKTLATAIKIGNPASWKGATDARDESGGSISTVTDDEIVAAYRILASEEGVFCEPASAASVAGVLKLSAARPFPEGSTIVCVLTGHGLKDPDRAIASVAKPVTVPAEESAVLRAMGL
ncbi:MAG TPA: threonine synthase [Armatimonadota bacterium]|jgi:threonine synthase